MHGRNGATSIIFLVSFLYSTSPSGLLDRLLALPFAGGAPLPPLFPGGGLTNAKSTSTV